ncbi:hypothetical protein [Bifidobacterium tibiigranuli]|uniref:hypothetical protein n=1 Tax=Bifidobacterium tibiigranuli TaxID=2172043 RepID=UPI0026F15B07|nr:hypothetical protein [Bifidobacterium tibiigranuli]MCI2185199.1 hypothetical protein [Bifidobacterium tibiigranuli]MCI2203236.1 hypothetical protein [Bifidobacterium tibiigranuli]
MTEPKYTSTGLNPDITEAEVDKLPIAEQIAYWKHRSRAAENQYRRNRKTAKLQAKLDRLTKEWERK